MATLMVDPVKLPSGHIMDKKVIIRHLLSSETNPFNRAPMKQEDLVPRKFHLKFCSMFQVSIAALHIARHMFARSSVARSY